MSKITNDGSTRSGTGCFIAVITHMATVGVEGLTCFDRCSYLLAYLLTWVVVGCSDVVQGREGADVQSEVPDVGGERRTLYDADPVNDETGLRRVHRHRVQPSRLSQVHRSSQHPSASTWSHSGHRRPGLVSDDFTTTRVCLINTLEAKRLNS